MDAPMWSLILDAEMKKAGFIAVMKGKITFEQFVDHVRSIEPECGECNSFVCTCVKAEAVPEVEYREA